MHYVEIMRARRLLFCYMIVLVAIVVLTGLSLLSGGHLSVRGESSHGTIHYSSIVGGCFVFALIIATLMAPSLNAEFSTVPIAWTRPVARERIAWAYVGIDIATIAIAYAMGLAAVTLILWIVGAAPYLLFDPGPAAESAVGGMGCAVMWYGLVSVTAARLPGRGTLLAGLSWGVFLVTAGLAHAPFPPLIHALLVAFNYLNPMAYARSAGSDPAMIPWSPELRDAATWAIGLVALVAATRLWSTKEV